ncbi:B12-binding domain-containing radical SAM protein [Planctomycetota bacterium]
MSGVLLASVPSSIRNANPLLGQLYLAASLRAKGIEVGLLDLASLYGPRDVTALARALDEQQPEVLGLTLFTETALPGYDLLHQLGRRDGVCVVAGGPHPTAEPRETLEHGFDLVVLGEGEETLVELVRALRDGVKPASVPGLAWLDEGGSLRTSSRRHLPADLDHLASPASVLDLWERDRYRPQGSTNVLTPALITSRGCPGRCAFCANHVSGRRYRFHSVERVVEEAAGWQERHGATVFFFQDTSFTAHRERLIELCEGLADLDRPLTWICKSRCDHLDSERARAVADAGCSTVFLGVESGAPAVLARIGKDITLGGIEGSLIAAREAGLRTYVHLMFGFPDETVAELDETLALMERLGPLIDGYGPGGVLVPYPGTAIYRAHHEALGCTRWWLDRGRLASVTEPFRRDGETTPTTVDDVLALHAEIENGALAANLVPYADGVRAAIDRCLAFRRAHNRRMLETPRRS